MNLYRTYDVIENTTNEINESEALADKSPMKRTNSTEISVNNISDVASMYIVIKSTPLVIAKEIC
jgi:hypothetical protein